MATFSRSLEVAEASRETEWREASFLRDLFLGDFRLELLHPYPGAAEERREFREWMRRFHDFLRDRVDPAAIDRAGEYPADVIDGLRALGAFGMKIPKEYGGLGFTQHEYAEAMELLGSWDANVTALLSAHQSIGAPQPLWLFGSEELKRKYLPLCAKGAISAFALTEPAVGSDPASLATTVVPSDDGRSFLLNGEKLWCTNGTLAEILVVMARNPHTDRISAFVVETSWPGVEVGPRSHFMGLKALANGVIRFRDVVIPRENVIGREGQGLKIALTTLNTGRLTLPAATTGSAKTVLEICRKWSRAREQWGQPIGRHEAITHKLADMAATTFAMEAISDLCQELGQRPHYDIRLEAAAAKEWNTVRQWELLDEGLQIRGGRGYETEESLETRGEAPIGIERAVRDARINRIFEGTSEIMHLFMAREAVDKHLSVAGPLVYGKATPAQQMAAIPRILSFYAGWYPSRWLGWGRWPRYAEFGDLARHLRFVNRSSRKLARHTFHAMVIWRGGMQKKEAFLFRVVDVALELFAMTAVICRVQRMKADRHPEAAHAGRLAELFCRRSRRKVGRLFQDLWQNEDALKNLIGRQVLEGQYAWLEKGAMPTGYTVDDLRPHVPEMAPVHASGAETHRDEKEAPPPPAGYA